MEKEKAWYKKIENWGIIIACIILVPILLANIYIMIQSKLNQDKVPNLFGYKPFIVLSGSMETEIHKGDLVLTKIVNPKSLKKNEVIAFRDSEGTVTTHRIIDIVENDGEKYFITKGDNNSSQDQNLVKFKDVEGKYVTRIPSIGSIMKSLSEPTTVIIILLGITAIFAMGFTISTKRQREIEQREYMEFKLQKEQEEKKKEKIAKENDTNKTNSSKKASSKKTASSKKKKSTTDSKSE